MRSGLEQCFVLFWQSRKMQNYFFLSPQLKWVFTTEVWKLTPGRKLFLKFDFSRLILACFHFGHLFLNWDIYAQNGLSKVESRTLTKPRFLGFPCWGGRKGGLKTAKPHRKTYENRNAASKFTKIPKPQLQMWKLSSRQYLRSVVPVQMWPYVFQ